MNVEKELSVEEDVYWEIADMIEPYVRRDGINPEGALPASVHDSVAILLEHWVKSRKHVGQEPVAEIIQNPTLHVYIDWKGKTIMDHIGAKLYAAPIAPVAYQSRHALGPLGGDGWGLWNETGRAEFERLSALIKENPDHFGQLVQVRALGVLNG